MTRRLALLLLVAVAAAHAADERARIAAERTAAQKAYDAQYRACQSEFAVTACVDRAKARRRATLEQLAQQQAVLDDADRRKRAAQRAQAIHEKLSQNPMPAPQRAASAPPIEVHAPRAARPASASAPRKASSAPALSDEQRARNRAEYQLRQREAAEHAQELQRRAQEHASKPAKAVTALPARPEIPPASAASR